MQKKSHHPERASQNGGHFFVETTFLCVCRKKAISVLIAHTDQQQKSRGILSACRHCCHLLSGPGVHCKPGPLPLPHSELRVTYFLYAADRSAAQPRYGIGGVAVAPSHKAKIALPSDQEPKGITCKEAERIQWRSHVPAIVTVAWSNLGQVWPLITRFFHEYKK